MRGGDEMRGTTDPLVSIDLTQRPFRRTRGISRSSKCVVRLSIVESPKIPPFSDCEVIFAKASTRARGGNDGVTFAEARYACAKVRSTTMVVFDGSLINFYGLLSSRCSTQKDYD